MNKKYIKPKAKTLDKKDFEGFSDFDTEPIGGSNPYYKCISCGISVPQINYNLLNHSETCEYRIKKLEEMGLN